MIHLNLIDGGVVKYTTDLLKEKRMLHKSLQYEFPDKEFSQKYRDNKWDGYIRFYNKSQQTFPIGFLDIVIEYLNTNNIQYKYINSQQKFTTTCEISDKMREYQIPAVKSFLKNKHGIIKIPTRGGKTFVASECIRHIITSLPYSKVLFFTDSVDLFNQAINDISSYFNIPKEHIGQIREQIFDIKQITVCTIQTIHSMLFYNKRNIKSKETLLKSRQRNKLLLNYIQEINFLIVDECHEYSSKDRLSILNRFEHSEFKLFISATPFKSESELDNLNLRNVCGCVIYSIQESDLKDSGFLAQDICVLFDVDHNSDKNIQISIDDKFEQHIREIITHNRTRNSILLNCIEIFRKMKLKTLVLFNRKKHGFYIQSITGDPFITSDINKQSEREFLKTSFLRKKGGVLFASDVFKKGITLPEVEVFINAGGGLEQSLITQKLVS